MSTRTSTGRSSGFTLLEVMITVGIVAILAAIAVPNYSIFVMRGKIIDATTTLGDLRERMEKYFMDNRTYLNGGACAVVADGRVAAYNGNPSSHFTILPPVCTATTYTFEMDGKAASGMNGFKFTIDQANTKTTAGVPAGWVTPVPNLCWVTRKDGTCG